MSQTIRPAPVLKRLVVRAPQEKAFRVFAEGFDRWWPRTHKIGKSAMVRAVVEPRVGGRWYEVGEDGAECDWGEVIAWEPPERLMLNWRIGVEGQYDPARSSEVEVTFTALGPDETEVRLEHRGLERLGAGGEQVRARVDGPNGWGALLGLYQTAAEA